MKTKKAIIIVLFALLMAHIATAYYCPSTGRWLSRDPMGDPGFQALRMAAQIPVALSASRWINCNAYRDTSDYDQYEFAKSDPIICFDVDGRISVNSCDTDLQQALQNNAKTKNFLGELKKKKCPDPGPSCKCCSPGERGGGFDPSSKKVTICANAWNNGSGVIAAVVHELTHALDDSQQKIGISSQSANKHKAFAYT